MSAMAISEQVKVWGVAVRAYAYPASIVPVLVGSVYAFYVTGSFHWPHFLLAMLAGMLYHTGANLVNDYYDHKYGVDRPGTFGGSGVLVDGTMTPATMALGALLCFIVGTAIGGYFLWHFSAQYSFGWPLLLIGLGGLLSAVYYTATKKSAKYNALGEPLVFLAMGVGMVLGGYFVQAGNLSWHAVLVSLPVSLIVAAILQANDTRDIVDDREAGIRTFSTLFGPGAARAFYGFLMVSPYLVVVILSTLHVLPWWGLLPLLTLPLALKLLKVFWDVRDEKHEALHPVVENTAKLHMAFGVLLSLGILLGHWL